MVRSRPGARSRDVSEAFHERPHPRLQPRGERSRRRPRRGGRPGPFRRDVPGHHRRKAGRDGEDDRLALPLEPGGRHRADLELLPRGRRPGDGRGEGRLRQLVADEPGGAGRDAPAPRRPDARAAVRAPRAPRVRDREGLVRGRRRDRRGDRLLRVLRAARPDPLPVPPADAPRHRGQLLLLHPARRRRGRHPLELPARDPRRHDDGRGRRREHRRPQAELRHADPGAPPRRDGPRGRRPGGRHQPRPRVGRRDRRLHGDAPGRALRLVHRVGGSGPPYQRDHRQARPAEEVDDPLRLRDGRQERDHRRRDGGPRVRLDRRRPLRVRLPGTEVLGLLPPHRRPARPRQARRAGPREGEADPRRRPLGRPLRLHRARRERLGATRASSRPSRPARARGSSSSAGTPSTGRATTSPRRSSTA